METIKGHGDSSSVRENVPIHLRPWVPHPAASVKSVETEARFHFYVGWRRQCPRIQFQRPVMVRLAVRARISDWYVFCSIDPWLSAQHPSTPNTPSQQGPVHPDHSSTRVCNRCAGLLDVHGPPAHKSRRNRQSWGPVSISTNIQLSVRLHRCSVDL